jgi:hypothetical protein
MDGNGVSDGAIIVPVSRQSLEGVELAPCSTSDT